MNIEIHINIEDRVDIFDFNFDSQSLESFIKHYLTTSESKYDDIILNYNFVSETTQININKEFLHHDYNTDIITFNLSEDTNELIGDIYINPSIVQMNAKDYNVSYFNEMNRVLIHGFFHLLGYLDKTEEEETQMRLLENKYLDYINVPRGT